MPLNENPAGVPGPSGAGIASLGHHSNLPAGRRPQQLRLATRRTLEWRLIWFRLEDADGFALEVQAKVQTTGAEMDDALAGALAMLGADLP